jgi:iron complex transport system permease protein
MQIRTPALLLLLGLGALASLALALAIGSGSTGPAEMLAALTREGDQAAQDIVFNLRLPRALAAFGTGACLALAGVLMQVLLRNPLADPYILGTSGGAAVAALTAMLLGAAGLLIDAAAFGGALASTFLVFGLARERGEWAP